MNLMESTRRAPAERLTGEERRKQIIRTASRMFARNGYSGTTTQDIAEAAGISHTLIFQHFSSKEKLFEAIIENWKGKEPLKQALNGQLQSDSEEEVCHAIAEHNFRYARVPEGQEMMRLLTYISLEKPSLFRQHLKQEGLEAIELIADYFANWSAAGVFKDINPYVAAHAFLGMIRNYLWNSQVSGVDALPDCPDEEVVDAFVSIFLDGIRR